MIGALAGDIIGSPYTHNNLEDPGKFVGWNLFEESRTLHFRNRKSHGDVRTVAQLDGLTERQKRQYEAVEKSYGAGRSSMRDYGEICSYLLGSDSGALLPDTLASEYAVAVACGEYSRSAEEAVRKAAEIVQASQMRTSAMQGACAGAHAVWMAAHGSGLDEVKKVMENVYGLEFRSEDEQSFLLKGQFVKGEDGKLVIGDGNPDTSLQTILPVALDCVIRSRSWEEAVRRSVAMGGYSAAVAAMTGALAEHVFVVPQEIKARAKDYFSATELQLVDVFESRARSTAERRSDKIQTDNSLQVIRQEGRNSIYVIPENRPDMEAAARRVCSSLKRDFMMIRPEQLQDKLAQLAEQKDLSGNVLSGTYFETSRPEVCRLWLQDGKLNTSTSRKAVGEERLPSVERRMSALNSFEELKAYANDVRNELEAAAGISVTGRHVHFAEAFYPEVKSRSIDLMQGDVLRGRIRLDDMGMISVDTNVSTGINVGEYLEGVLNTMDIFHKNDGVAEIKQKLNEYCLDYGKIEDEDERMALKGDDSEAVSVKMKYTSNVDQAILDMSRERELHSAVVPDLTSREVRRNAVREQKRIDSIAKNEGRSREEAVGATLHVGSVFTIGHSNLSDDEFRRQLKHYGIDTLVDIRSFPKSKNYPHFNGDVLKDSLEEAGMSYVYSGKEMGGHILRRHDEKCNLYLLEGEGRKPEYMLFKDIDACREYCREVNRKTVESRRIQIIEPVALKPERWNDEKGMEEYRTDLKTFMNSKECSQELAGQISVRCGDFLSYEESMSREGFKEKLSEIRAMVKEGKRVAVMCSEGDPEACHRFAMVGYALRHPSDGRMKEIDVQHITRKGTLLSQDYLEGKLIKSYGLSDRPDALEVALRQKCVSLISKTKDDNRIRLSKPKARSMKR